MKKVKISELAGAALDYAVADAEERLPSVKFHLVDDVKTPFVFMQAGSWRVGAHYSDSWSQCGPVIEREFIELTVIACGHDDPRMTGNTWAALKGVEDADAIEAFGPTPLVAAMRCFLAYKHRRRGKPAEHVDIPKELL